MAMAFLWTLRPLNALANPARFATLLRTLTPWLAAAAFGFLAVGAYYALLASPIDYQQGEMVRVMYIHVPAAWWSMGLYAIMTVSSSVFLIWRHSVADVIARETAPVALAMTGITLVTGALWGKPTWGAYWVWDARLTSVLILFFILLAYHVLARQSYHQFGRQKACAWFCLLGAVNLPIIKFSVEWWNTLHQPASILRSGGAAIAPEMLWPLALMGLGFLALCLCIIALRVQTTLMRAKLLRMTIRQR
jgi:heme exporter protein C